MEAAHGGEYPPPGSPLSGVRAAWFAAAKAGDVAAAAALLAGGAHLDEGGAELRCERGATAMMWAAAEGACASFFCPSPLRRSRVLRRANAADALLRLRLNLTR